MTGDGPVRVSVLGPLRVEGRTLTTGSLANAVLLVVSDAHTGCSADQVCEEIWGDRDRRGALRKQVAHLNRRLDGSSVPLEIRIEDSWCRLLGSWTRDCHDFMLRTAEAGRELELRPDRAGLLVGAALDLWRGEPFTGAAPTRLLQRRAQTLREQHRRACALAASSDLRAGHPHAAVRRLRALGADLASGRSTRGLLCESLHATGRHVEAQLHRLTDPITAGHAVASPAPFTPGRQIP